MDPAQLRFAQCAGQVERKQKKGPVAQLDRATAF